MTRYTFEEVTHKVTRQIKCRMCGKPMTRSTTLSQTMSPFNRDESGQPKTRQQIHAELREQAKTWEPTNNVHAACVEAEQAPEAAS